MTKGPIKRLYSIPIARGVTIITKVSTYICKNGRLTPSVLVVVNIRKVKGRLGEVGDEID